MGEGERHARFSLEGASARARGVAFGVNGSLAKAAEAGAMDVSVSLELNHWNGAVEPRVVLGELYDEPEESPAGEPGRRSRPGGVGAAGPRRGRGAAGRHVASSAGSAAPAGPSSTAGARSGVATVAALASSGEPVLAVCADALRRRALVERAAAPARFGGGAGGARRGRPRRRRRPTAPSDPCRGWRRARRLGASRARARLAARLRARGPDRPAAGAGARGTRRPLGARGFLHLAWGPAEVEFALAGLGGAVAVAPGPRQPLPPPRRAGRRRRRRSTPAALRRALAGEGAHPRSPEVAARACGCWPSSDSCARGWDGSRPSGAVPASYPRRAPTWRDRRRLTPTALDVRKAADT